MSTLTTAPLASALDRLFADADRTRVEMNTRFGLINETERHALLNDETRYAELYKGIMKDVHIPVSRETGLLLYILARGAQATSIVEFGTSFGISTLHLAAAVRDNGRGRVITCEFEAGKAATARATFAETGVGDLIELREGDALDTLARDLPETIDLVLLDGAKSLYSKILALLEPRLRSGALVVADNADMVPDYLIRVRAPASGYLSVPFGEEVELSMKL
jgi:predicted O-methyltransferase YrrM